MPVLNQHPTGFKSKFVEMAEMATVRIVNGNTAQWVDKWEWNAEMYYLPKLLNQSPKSLCDAPFWVNAVNDRKRFRTS